MEPWKRERTWSYAEDSADALVARPRDEEELRHILLRARELHKRVTFQGAGHSLDRQALCATDQVVVVMDAFDELSFEEPLGADGDAWVTAGAGVRWGDILRACAARGLVPYVVVTSSGASVGGTVSADCLSRFTSDFGKESKLISGIRLMTADGRVHELTRPIPGAPGNPPQSPLIGGLDPMLGIIGGFGLLGAVIRVRFLAHRVADKGDKPLMVRSVVRKYTTLEPLLEALLSRAFRLVEDKRYRNPRALFAVASYTKSPDVWMNILISSYYVRASPERGRRMPQHMPDSMVRPLGEWLKRIPGFTSFFWRGVHAILGKRYIDPLHDYTFFMDGNVTTKEIERALGIRTKVRQQTYLIPTPVRGRTFDGRIAADFLRTLRDCCQERGLHPILLDVLFVPSDDAYLSGSRQMPAVAVTTAFEPLFARRTAEVEELLCELARRAARVGGRIHLTKRVCADAPLVAGAYGEGLRELAQLKAALDPHHLFDSTFAESVLRPAARHAGVDL